MNRLFIFVLFSSVLFSCSSQVKVKKTSYIMNKSELLEYSVETVLNDSVLIEKKYLFNKLGNLSWSENSSREQVNDFIFRFFIKGDTIFILQTFKKGKESRLPVFSLNVKDTLEAISLEELANGNIQYRGEVVFAGKRQLNILGKETSCYVFKIDEGTIRSSPIKRIITEYYISENSLIPVKILTKAIIVKNGLIDSSSDCKISKITKL